MVLNFFNDNILGRKDMQDSSTQENTGITSDNIGGCGIGFVSNAVFPGDKSKAIIAKRAERYCRDVVNIRRKSSKNERRSLNRKKQEMRLLAKIRKLVSLHPWLAIPNGFFIS